MYEDITGEYDLFSTLDTTSTDNKKKAHRNGGLYR